ncbi:MAG TPA: restriction endonuclease subunit S [Thermoanaerobacterales bacterium]|nr:restriction endonuclease subunit S [Thermoanaerobacterales bacterium]
MKLVPKRRFKGFSGEWEEKALGDLADIVGGGTPSTSNPSYWDGDIDWYSPTEIGDKVFVGSSVKAITQLGLEKSSANILPANRTVLFTSRAGIGDMAILRRPGATNQGFQSLVLKDGMDTYFVYSMGHSIKREAIKKASGSTFLEISGKELGKIKLPVPSEAEQQRIGSFFTLIDEMIDNERCNLEKLKIMKQAYLHEMFPAEGESVPKRRFAGFEQPWKMKKLDDLGATFSGLLGKTKQDFGKGKAEFVPYLNVFNNPVSDIHYTEQVEIDKRQNEVRFGDVFFTTSSETPEEVGMSSVWLDDRKNVYLNSFCFGYRLRENVEPLFMAYGIDFEQD